MSYIHRLFALALILAAGALSPALATVDDGLPPPKSWPTSETLEAQAPGIWDNPIYIKAVYQVSRGILVEYAELHNTMSSRPADQTYSPDGMKAFLKLKVPAIVAEYESEMSLALKDIAIDRILYTSEAGVQDPYQMEDWSYSSFLGWVYIAHSPWVYHLATQQWLYFGEQVYDLNVDFAESPEAHTWGSWFKPFQEWDGAMTVEPTGIELYDSVAFHFWSSKSGWLISDANLYPFCWSRAIEAWMLHRTVSVTSTLDSE